MAGEPAITEHGGEQLRPLGSSASNRWAVSETRANLVRPLLAPRPITVRADAKLLTIDLARTAIIVIDMQNDFCTRGGWFDSRGIDLGPARGVIGPKGLTAAQVAYWENVLARVVDSDEWKKDLDNNFWEAQFLNSADTRKLLKNQYDEYKSVLIDVGLAR